MSIFAENLIDKYYKKETYTKYEIVSIMTLTSTYKKNHTSKSEYYNKSNEMLIKILTSYDFKNVELNNFIKEHINMFFSGYNKSLLFFDYTKHKILLEDLNEEISISVDSIKNNKNADEFVNKYLFNNKFNVRIDNLYNNNFILNSLNDYIEQNINKNKNKNEITDFAEKICVFLHTSDNYEYLKQKTNVDANFTNTKLAYKFFHLIVAIYVITKHHDKYDITDEQWNSLDEKFKNIFLLFSIFFKADKNYYNIKFTNFITQKHLELAFKYKNLDAVKAILNLKFKPNIECLKNIFIEQEIKIYYTDDYYAQLLNLFTENQKITQEIFIIILKNTIPKEIPQDIIITDEIINLYCQKQFEQIKDTIKDKEVFEKIIANKINSNNFTPIEIKNMYETLKECKITLQNINKDNIEKIGNKTIKNNITKYIK